MKANITTWCQAILCFVGGLNSYAIVLGNDNKEIGIFCNYTIPDKPLIGSLVALSNLTTASVQAQTNPVPTVAIIQPTCSTPTGTITVTWPTGPGFAYSLDNGAFQNSAVFPDLMPYSIYCIKVKDRDGNYYEPVFVELIKPTRPKPPTVIATHPDCGHLTGSIMVMFPLGTQYSYSINGVDYQASTVFENLPHGNYFVTVRSNTLGCGSKNSEIYINQPPKDCYPAGIFHTSVTCSDY